MSQWATKGWYGDYDAAERAARNRDRPLVLDYRDSRSQGSTANGDALSEARVQSRLKDYVCCRLYSGYEPDRRFLAQFGVERAPALVVVHRDGTYHAQSGATSAEEVLAFLASSHPPGSTPRTNPLIPRKPHYDWLKSLERVDEAVGQTGRPALIVYYRSVSSDWLTLGTQLGQREVWRQVKGWVHARIGVWDWDGGDYDTRRFGAVRLPALVIVQPDGTFNVLERPDSAERIASFAMTAGRSKSTASALPAVSRGNP